MQFFIMNSIEKTSPELGKYEKNDASFGMRKKEH